VRQKLLPVVGFFFIVAGISLQAQRGPTSAGSVGPTSKPDATAPSGQPEEPPRTVAPSSTYLRATMGTSRSEVTIDGSYGVFADFENLASVPITLFEHETQLVIQPEVTGSGVCNWRLAGWFPTEYEDRTLDLKQIVPPVNPPTVQAGAGRPIRIRPQEHYTVFWSLGRPTTTTLAAPQPVPKKPTALQVSQSQGDVSSSQSSEVPDPCATKSSGWSWLNFVPGDYLFTIDAKFYLPDAVDAVDYHTFTQTTKLTLKIPQHYAMWAAAFGALLAYFVVLSGQAGGSNPNPSPDAGTSPLARRKKIAIWIRDGVSAALLGAAITIVASRLSNTEFPIKVSVNDIWGAVTVGFVGYFTGNKIIDKLRGKT
jgi:hypothetical protein